MDCEKTLKDYDIISEDLDDLVHDEASKEASRINNEGMREQIEFLTEKRGLSVEEIVESIQGE